MTRHSGVRRAAIAVLLAGMVAVVLGRGILRSFWVDMRSRRGIDRVLAQYGPSVRSALEPMCARHGISWPPRRLCLLAFKKEKVLEAWVGDSSGEFILLKTYPIVAASGEAGPKRRQGDRQVPEGFYDLPELNPYSNYHLSIRVGYPNQDDLRNSRLPRGEMGGDIYIHGSDASIGCLAMGDPAIEELFCLAAYAESADRRIIISPVDFRSNPEFMCLEEEAWVQDLHCRIRRSLEEFGAPAR